MEGNKCEQIKCDKGKQTDSGEDELLEGEGGVQTKENDNEIEEKKEDDLVIYRERGRAS